MNFVGAEREIKAALLKLQKRKTTDTLKQSNIAWQFNDTYSERLVFHLIQYRNGWMAASNLFHMFTESIKFCTLHYQYRCLKNVIH